MATVHVVSHTHWDREWYQPAARVRQRLVALVDELLDAPPTAGTSFLLDGQSVVLRDYLDVRPERANDLRHLLAHGAIEAGPWFVLADELIPGGEALVRNLLAGRRDIRDLGAEAPRVLYCPDSFGHPAALPMLAAGFGYDVIIALRGFGGARWPSGDSAWWRGPDGARVLLFHLAPGGYETGVNLPTDADAAAARWAAIRQELLPRSRLDRVLLMNGADHHARQRDLDRALAALSAAARPDTVRPSSLGTFVRGLAEGASASLPEIAGELRDSYGYVWTLQGTFAARAHQKRRNAMLERLLVRDAEPWAALAARRGALSRRSLVNAAWRSLLLCHPHDTLCGCSTDEVARAMDARLDEAEAQGRGIREDALLDVIGHARDVARTRANEWKPMALVRNRAAWARDGVAILRLSGFLADVKVGMHAGTAPGQPVHPRRPALEDVGPLQVLARGEKHELTESPRHYPDDDLVSVFEVAAWVPAVPAYGVRCFLHTARAGRQGPPSPARAEKGLLANGRLTLTVSKDGVVTLEDHVRGVTLDDLVRWESRTDLGDLYTASIRGAKLTPHFGGVRVVHRGPLRAAIEMRWTFGSGRDRVRTRVRFLLDAGAPYVRVEVTGDHQAQDHRLRLGLATGVSQPRVFADAMFGPVERRPIEVSATDLRMETPPPTAPLHRYVSLFARDRGGGATVYSDGLGEYEADETGTVFITLVRAVGALSRNDMPERAGHAGWPTPTPEAQCLGPFTAALAIMTHGDRTDEVVDLIERTADDVLLPLTGATLRSSLVLPEPVDGIALEGPGLAFSTAKESEDGRWLVLRCVNLLASPVAGSWRLGIPVAEARLARLDETPGAPLSVAGQSVEFVAPPRGVVTVLVR